MARPGQQGTADVKLLRTIRLDPSDTFVFEKAAEPGEWAVSGAFVFWDTDAAALQGKARSAFRSGFLGVESLGWSTLVQIVEADAADRARVVDLLAEKLVAHFAEQLCTEPKDILVGVHRSFEDGAVRETFRTLRPRAGAKPNRVFEFLEVEGADDDQSADQVDLLAMADRERK